MTNRSLLRSLFLVTVFAAACAPPTPLTTPGDVVREEAAQSQLPAPQPPPIQREFRAAWVASVNNIDWPSRPGLTTQQQQAELIAILDRAVWLNLNAIVLQVRPATDALYPSALEPWSQYLTGRMGQAPNPYYDPLEFAVREAHARGLELHAWINPYRAKHASSREPISDTHVSRTKPHLVRTYGRSLWLDPGDPETRRHSLDVVLDIVTRYDVDGAHIDDYFYPYQERDSVTNALIPFPDSATWARYSGPLSRDDWRRNNVDLLVEELHAGIRRVKPEVMFGVSPFGLWRPNYPPGVPGGFDAYASIYADARKWFNNGWVDYFTPQLYWANNYKQLLDWWATENTHRRHLWVGNFTSRSDTIVNATKWRATEILNQIAMTRGNPGATGNVHFSMRSLMDNRDSIADRLKRGPYAAPALVPRTPWIDSIPPATPRVYVTWESGRAVTHLRPGDSEYVWLWTVRSRHREGWRTAILPGQQYSLPVSEPGDEADYVWVTAVDRAGNESEPVSHALSRPGGRGY